MDYVTIFFFIFTLRIRPKLKKKKKRNWDYVQKLYMFQKKLTKIIYYSLN